MILVQSPTNSPNNGQKQDKPEEVHVCALFRPKIGVCKLLIISALLQREEQTTKSVAEARRGINGVLGT